MPQFLYRIRPARTGYLAAPTPEECEAVEDHFDYLAGLTRQAVVLLAGRTTNDDVSMFGIVLLEAPSEAAARDVMVADPAVAAKVFAAELFPYRVALASPRLLDLAPSDPS